MTFHPQIIERKGKKEFVVLSYEEFLSIQEALEDFEDLKELRKEKAKANNKPTTPLNEAAKKLNL